MNSADTPLAALATVIGVALASMMSVQIVGRILVVPTYTVECTVEVIERDNISRIYVGLGRPL